jgi:4-hydroxythreonine-4-phosphate dehydrogenase
MIPDRKTRTLAISMGDPAGIGTEIILKAVAASGDNGARRRLIIVGDLGAMRDAARKLGNVPEPFPWTPEEPLPDTAARLPVFSVGTLSAAARRPGRPSLEGADAAYRYIVTGARMALNGQVSALVTAPISKEWVNRAGHRFPGHTELLAKLSKARLWRMMFAGDTLRLALVTVHIGLARVPAALTINGVFATIELLASHLRDRLGLRKPKIGVLGLNPHAGEGGLFGTEEIRIIAPAIERARRAGITCTGPLAPDTAFARPRGKLGFDAAVAMYPDQGLIALKTLEFDRAVNVTLGLPFVRTSPDHGTAFDIAGKGCADAGSMKAAIAYAAHAGGSRRAAATERGDG